MGSSFGLLSKSGQTGWTRVAAVIVLVALVALAGCGSPGDVTNSTASDGSPGGTVAAGPTTAADDGATEAAPTVPSELTERGIDVRAVWNRTEQIVGVEAERPTIDVRNYAGEFPRKPLLTTLTGSGPGSYPGTPAAFYRLDAERVVMIDAFVRDEATGTLAAILAHEYAHAIQYQQGWGRYEYPSDSETDHMVVPAYTEGFATYVEQRYAKRHANADPVGRYWAQYANASTYARHRIGPYVYGYRYYQRSVNETGVITSAVAEPPVSSEQILHDTTDAPRELELRVDYDGMNWSAAQQAPAGELFTRIVLRDELGKERAIAAAKGWGADRVRRLESRDGNRSGYVWVQRWDTTADADEFDAALADYLEDRRPETTTTAFEAHRLAPETTALVLGNQSFVDRTTVVSGSNASARVAVGG